MDWIVAAVIVLVGAGLAYKRSTWIVDYTVYVFVLNRGIRRLLDWHAGAFNPLSPVSLSPLLVTGVMFLAFWSDYKTLPSWARRIFGCLLGAIAYAAIVGFIRVRFAALYALAEMLGPIALFGFVFVTKATEQVRDRWIRSFAWGAILTSAYGWYQFLTIPPWDAFWVEAVGFVGYLGILEPTKMTVFSTMGERGVLAGYLGFSIVPMLLSSRWRTVCSWPGVILVFSVILLTQSRGGVILVAVSTLLFLLVNRGANGLQIAIAVIVIGTAAWFGIKKLPNADTIQNRFATLGNMTADGSYQGRMEIFSSSWKSILINPFGYGLGAAGLAGRVNTGDLSGQAVVMDAGYLEIAGIYGWLGTALFVTGLWRAWKALAAMNCLRMLRTSHVLLARAFMVAMIPACFAGNFLGGLSIFWLALGCALSPNPNLRRAFVRARASSKEGNGRANNPDPKVVSRLN